MGAICVDVGLVMETYVADTADLDRNWGLLRESEPAGPILK
jgi:hypothetical protein